MGRICDTEPAGCLVGSELLVTATDRCPLSARAARVTYKQNAVEVRIVARTPGNGGFDLGLEPAIDLGIYADYSIGVTAPRELTYECHQ